MDPLAPGTGQEILQRAALMSRLAAIPRRDPLGFCAQGGCITQGGLGRIDPFALNLHIRWQPPWTSAVDFPIYTSRGHE